MKISNFRNVVKIPSTQYKTFYSVKADVDVTTRHKILWWKTKTETRQVFKGEMAINWVWVETGQWTPGYDVEQLYKAHCAQEEINRV